MTTTEPTGITEPTGATTASETAPTPVPAALPDGRPIPPMTGDERPMLESWLEFHRGTLELKCAGLDDAQARAASAEPSELTLLGLVQHLTEVERNWFQRVLSGADAPLVYEEETGYRLSPERGLDEALDRWRREVARSREVCAGRALDALGRIPQGQMLGGAEVSLRWVLLHMIEEYARHNGHADIVRERVDGVTGY
ncbi:DinB family protein [Streptomyces sp. NPDC002643]